MALNVFTPPVPPSPGTKNKPKVKLREVEFGDGYTQSSPDGLNHIKRVVTLTWEVLTIEQAEAIETFFEEQGGYMPFLYALSDDSQRQWKCKEWDRTRRAPNSVSATLEEDFTYVGQTTNHAAGNAPGVGAASGVWSGTAPGAGAASGTGTINGVGTTA